MNRIWAPWRMPYIESADGTRATCLFCDCLAQPDNAENLVVHRAQHAFVILNRFPYTNGHMMVVPYQHVPTIVDLEPSAQAELMQLSGLALVVLTGAYGAQSFNVGINIGASAGAGIAEHVHVHVVPRWAGDTNFMATTAHTRVIPEDLTRTYQRLNDEWQSLTRGDGRPIGSPGAD
ncbi:MAG: HIT domain-containing protein [Anaerolineales bacterium]|nr:HIT domain-containing protein [Anaerolineales bacterium]